MVQQAGVKAGGLAPLQNVSLFRELMMRMANRHPDLPGLAVWYGPSGFGKTKSATHGANAVRAYYIDCGSEWTKGVFVRALATELGVEPKGVIADVMARIIVALRLSRRPLIIDEYDHVVERGYVELVREIHDKSGATIVLIGEEMLPTKLQRWERFANRVLVWGAAQPCRGEDIAALAAIYAPGITIAGDLEAHVMAETGGRTRRVAEMLADIAEHAATVGEATVDLKSWAKGGGAPSALVTGAPPRPRKVAS